MEMPMAFVIKFDHEAMEGWQFQRGPTEERIQNILAENFPGFVPTVMEI